MVALLLVDYVNIYILYLLVLASNPQKTHLSFVHVGFFVVVFLKNNYCDWISVAKLSISS